ncbi:hypothetical protein K466DRAFT_236465 [Polyporus arcularius HHB13444]|uniref:Uncharacterized protein n=1 Tax=Polyporus arcularius HHB13444 TaxID=1314778 RepID=A0A5C3PV82_9APHY|nr:hypothetical protein K466DRAFT_236465 [Polyporus arcularius HHB13444]
MLARWLPESFSACADLISPRRQALSVLHTVDIVTGSPSLWTGTGVIDAMEMSAQNVHAAWKPLDTALMSLRSLGRLEFTILDRFNQMKEEQRTRLRSIVEAGLSGVLSMHKGAHDFFHFKFKSRC